MGPHNRRRHRRRHRHGTRTGTGTPATGRTRTRAPGPGWSRMRDAWTTPEAKAGRTRPSIRGRSARCHRPRIRWGMISRPNAPASEPQHVGGAVEPADYADTIDLTPVGDRDAAMPCANGGAWPRPRAASCSRPASRSPACPRGIKHESATAARELEQATADCATAHAAAKKAEQKLVEYLDGDRLAQAKAVTADKLADPETLETLDKLAEQYSEGERIPACAATDTETANATTSKLQAIEKKHTGNLSRLKKAASSAPHGWPIPSNRANDCLPPPKARCRTNLSRPAARLHRQARREGHHRRHGQGERLHRREDQGRRGKESAGGGRSGCGGAGAEHAGTATVLVHALRLRFGPGFRPVRQRIHSSGGSAGSTGGSASPGWSVPANPDPSQLPGTDPSL